jgi:hypothetical protein
MKIGEREEMGVFVGAADSAEWVPTLGAEDRKVHYVKFDKFGYNMFQEVDLDGLRVWPTC